jgi:Coenzyme PQQ synthesis protein D (PqqD)
MRSQWPESTARPCRRDDVPAVPMDDNLAVYEGGLLILLNVGAAAVWSRCDGATTFQDIVADLGRRHEVDAGLVAQDAWYTVRQLAGLGLIREGSEA